MDSTFFVVFIKQLVELLNTAGTQYVKTLANILEMDGEVQVIESRQEQQKAEGLAQESKITVPPYGATFDEMQQFEKLQFEQKLRHEQLKNEIFRDKLVKFTLNQHFEYVKARGEYRREIVEELHTILDTIREFAQILPLQNLQNADLTLEITQKFNIAGSECIKTWTEILTIIQKMSLIDARELQRARDGYLRHDRGQYTVPPSSAGLNLGHSHHDNPDHAFLKQSQEQFLPKKPEIDLDQSNSQVLAASLTKLRKHSTIRLTILKNLYFVLKTMDGLPIITE